MGIEHGSGSVELNKLRPFAPLVDGAPDSLVGGSGEITAPGTVANAIDVTCMRPEDAHERPAAIPLLSIVPIAERSFQLEREARREAAETADINQKQLMMWTRHLHRSDLQGVGVPAAWHFAQALGMDPHGELLVITDKDIPMVHRHLDSLGSIPNDIGSVCGEFIHNVDTALVYPDAADYTSHHALTTLHEWIGHGSAAHVTVDFDSPLWKHTQEHRDVLPIRPQCGFMTRPSEDGASWEGAFWEEGFADWVMAAACRRLKTDADGMSETTVMQSMYYQAALTFDALCDKDRQLAPLIFAARHEPEAMHDFICKVNAIEPGLWETASAMPYDENMPSADMYKAFGATGAYVRLAAGYNLSNMPPVTDRGAAAGCIDGLVNNYIKAHPQTAQFWRGAPGS